MEPNNIHLISPFEIACENSNIELANFLLDKGASLNRQGQNALDRAIGRNSNLMITYLLEQGMVLGDKPDETFTDIIRKNKIMCLSLLLEHGITPSPDIIKLAKNKNNECYDIIKKYVR